MAGDLAVQLDRHVELAQRLQRLFQRDLAPVDGVALLPELVRDVARCDRAEEVVVLAHLALEDQLDGLQLLREVLGDDLLLGQPADGRALHLLDDGLVGGGRLYGELAGQQVVAAVAVGDLNHIAAVAELVDVFLEYDFHCISPGFLSPSGITGGA